MAFPDTACVAFRLSTAPYRSFFEEVWGVGSLDIKFPHDTESICEIPGGAAVFGTNTTPIRLKPEDRIKANEVYNHWGESLDQYEASPGVSAFSSKFDAFLAGMATLTSDEMAGYNLFKGKANCNSCHLDGRSTAYPTPARRDRSGQHRHRRCGLWQASVHPLRLGQSRSAPEFSPSNALWGLKMKRVLLTLALMTLSGGLLSSNPTIAQVLPPAKKAARVQIIQGPALELARNNWAIIRWTSNNPGGTDEHWGVVHYGYRSPELEPDGEIPHQAKPDASGYDFPRACGGS
jgi:hypothetical protein